MALSDYLQDASTLLRDESYLFTTKKQLTRWVNQSRTTLARESGCITRLLTGQSAFGAGAQPGSMIPGAFQPGALPGSFPNSQNATAQNTLQTIPGVERYPYQGFWNPYLQQQYGGLAGVIDVISLSVNWGGSIRPSLNWLPWDDFQAYCRSYANLVTSYPYVWSVMDDGPNGELWMFPAPSQANEMEAYCSCIPAYIYSDDDYDAIPDGMRNAIKFGAVSLAMLQKEKYAAAEMYNVQFRQAIGTARVAFDRGKAPSYYATAF